jgi:hypothetical protein
MSRYRKIDTRIWNDARFAQLSDSAKLVWFLLLTHPNMTALGAMRATLPGLAAELGWSTEAFREAFREAFAKGMAEHDEKACFVAIPRFLKYNPPESPNVVKAWVQCLDLLPECALKSTVIHRAINHLQGMSGGFAKALPEAFREALAKAMSIQEQEQEKEQEQKPFLRNAAADAAAGPVQSSAPPGKARQGQTSDLLGQPPPPPPTETETRIWSLGVRLLTAAGCQETQARSVLGRCRKQLGDGETLALLVQIERDSIASPVAWLTACLNKRAATSGGRRWPAANAVMGDGSRRYESTPDDQLPADLRPTPEEIRGHA